jgi:hypothetical protein
MFPFSRRWVYGCCAPMPSRRWIRAAHDDRRLVREECEMLRGLRKLGLTSDMMYAAGFGSIGLSILSWYVSKNKENAGLDRADRWGLFVGEWGSYLLRPRSRVAAR